MKQPRPYPRDERPAPRRVYVSNNRRGITLAFAWIAEEIDQRLRGLLDFSQLTQGEGMYFPPPCNALHTVGMKFPIDIVFIDLYGRVVDLIENMAPGNQASCPAAYSALELPTGAIRGSGTQRGDALSFEYLAPV